ncbi:MAG: hypothetical protein OXE59_11195 [Bacteroidetes bacterium]|nr:hypothetical protein [Bacteroidota bacterium]
MDINIAFDGQQADAFNAGDKPFLTRIGRNFHFAILLPSKWVLIAFPRQRATDWTRSVGRSGSPSCPLSIDYGFVDFGGLISD